MEAALNVLLKPKRQDWINVQECAKLVGRSESTVSRWAREGRIELRSVGGQRLVRNPCQSR
ncbi:helix-turn-helix domain-containing protein [uncultured Ruegeria sp.]|uniref:helix-turn-helix domain-containing protein n=1 Tax=uncultured Ruegeria sp. TaxID=259304 RepID=UPI0034159CB2